MADNKVKISFEIDGIEYTTDQLEQMAKASKDAAKETDNLGKQSKDTSNEVKDSGQKFEKLQSQIRQTRIELQKAAAAGDKVRFQELRGQLDDLEEGLEKTTFQSQQFDDQLAALPGPAGAAGNAIKSVDGLFKMLAANPVIAIIAVIAGLFMLLKESMEKTSKGQEVLNKMTEAFGKILGPVMLAIQKVAMPIFEALLYVIEKVAEGFQKFGELLGFSEKEIAEASRGVDKVREETEKKEEARQKAAEERAEKDKKMAEDAAAKEKELAEKRKAQAEEYRQNQKEINSTLADLRLQNIKDAEEKLRAELAANRKAALEEFKLKKATKEQIKALNAEYDKIDAAALEEFNRAKLEKTAAAEEALNDLKDQARLLSITNERERAMEELRIQEQEALEAVAKEENAEAQAAQIRENFRLQKVNQEAEWAKEDQEKYIADLQKKLETQIAEYQQFDNLALADREKKLADANAYFDNLLADEKLTNEQRIELEKKRGEVIKSIDDNIKQGRAQALDAIQGTFNALGSIFEQGSKEAKAFAVADAIINTYKAANTALASAPPPFNFILAAANVAAGIANVKKILSTKPGDKNVQQTPNPGTAAGGGAGTPTVPDISQVFQAVNSTGSNAVPQPNTPGGMGANQPVVKAYVVASDMTSQQEANAKIQNLATL